MFLKNGTKNLKIELVAPRGFARIRPSPVPGRLAVSYQQEQFGGPNPLRPTLTRWSASVRSVAKAASKLRDSIVIIKTAVIDSIDSDELSSSHRPDRRRPGS
jgi:hypothetical protein